MHEIHLFRDLAYIFIAATVGGLVAWRLKLPLILGFVVGGIAISQFTPGVRISDAQIYHEAAETGVVLLLFSIGLEFSVAELMRVKWVAIGGCAIGVALSIGLTVLTAKLLGWDLMKGVVVGAAISVASTMVLARLLADRGAMESTHGRVMIGITLVEDLVVVLMTVVLPSFASTSEDRFRQAAWMLGKAVILLIPLAFLAMKVIPVVLRRMRKLGDKELVLLVTLAICLGTAALAEAIGFSVALGAFLAGLAISGSEDLRETHDNMLPLRDAFVALFFVSLGTLIDPHVIKDNLGLLGAMLLLIIPGKFVIWTLVVLVFGYSMRNAVAVAAGLTQIGELSFVVMQSAVSVNMVRAEAFNTMLAASLISIFINVFIVRAVLGWAERKHTRRRAVVA